MAIAVLLLLMLIAIIGAVYTWYMGTHGKKPDAAKPVATKTQERKVPEMDPNAAVGVYIQSLTSEAVPGGNVAVRVRTQQYANCEIKVAYGGVESKDSGLVPKQADDYGMVQWSWTVEPTTPLGKASVDITCTRNKKSGYMHGDMKIVKELSQ